MLVRKQIGTAHMEKSMKAPQKKLRIGNHTTSNPNPGYISEEK